MAGGQSGWAAPHVTLIGTPELNCHPLLYNGSVDIETVIFKKKIQRDLEGVETVINPCMWVSKIGVAMLPIRTTMQPIQ